MSYYQKYLKYKNKYNHIKNLDGGSVTVLTDKVKTLPDDIKNEFSSYSCNDLIRLNKETIMYITQNRIQLLEYVTIDPELIERFYTTPSFTCENIFGYEEDTRFCNLFYNKCFVATLANKFINGPIHVDVKLLNTLLLRSELLLNNNVVQRLRDLGADGNYITITKFENKNIINDEYIIPYGTHIIDLTPISISIYNQLINIKNVKIPNTVVKIGEQGLITHTSKLIIPNSVVQIDDYAFNTNQITELFLSNSIKKIGNHVFGYNQITKLIIPTSVTTIGNNAFSYNHIAELIIPNSVTSIGNSAFERNRITKLIIPSSVTSIGNSAFSFNNISQLILPNSITTIGNAVFSNNKIAELLIPNSVTTIGSSTFSHNQITKLTIPNSVTIIGEYAFANNEITELILPNTIHTIHYDAFSYNPLKYVTLPRRFNDDNHKIKFFGTKFKNITFTLTD